VGHREADVQVIPVLGLADGADRREVPLHVIGQPGLGDHFVAVEVTADVVPLAAAIHHLAPCIKLQGTAHAGGVAYFVDQRLAHQQRFVHQLVWRFGTVSGEEAIEIPLPRQVLVQHQSLRVCRLGQFQATGLPVAPAVGSGQVLREFARKLVGIFPASQAQQQAQAPFGNGVVAQLGVVLGHHLKGAWVEALGQGQTDLTGNRDFFVTGEVHAAGIAVEHGHCLVGVLARQAAKAQAHGVRHRLGGRQEARRVAEHLGLLRYVHHQAALGAEGRQGFHQAVGQRVVAGFGGELGAVPDSLFGELAIRSPLRERGITGRRLGFTGQPEFFGGLVAFGLEVVGQLELAMQAIELDEIELGVVVLFKGLPVATVGQPAQPTQLHPVGLGQVAVFGEELFDFLVAGALQAGGQFVVRQIRRQRVIGQGLAVLHVRAGIAPGQGAFGFIVILTLSSDVHGQGRLSGGGRKKQTR